MFRKPPSTNPPSKPATNPAPTKRPMITRGNVASLVQLHNTRVQEQEASAAPPAISRSVTGQGRGQGRVKTFGDVPDKTSASHVLSWNPRFHGIREDTSPFQNRRESLAQQRPAIPRGHSPLAQTSRRVSTIRHQEPQDIHRERQSRRSITGIHANDQYAWQQDSAMIAREYPWSRRTTSQRKPSLTTTAESEPVHSIHQPPPSNRRDSRRDSRARESLPPGRIQPMSEDSIPPISDEESREMSLDRTLERKDNGAINRTSSERSGSSYIDSRQGLFYGDRLPPAPPAPPAPSQASPTAERMNPFQRRNSSASTIRSASPFASREPISHKAFERVRSISPPSINIHTPAPQRPSEPSIAKYITRKLSQHWTEPPMETLGSPPVVRVPPSSPLPVHHIDSSLVQDILSSIDSVLTEHTTALQTVITQSHQLLHEKEHLCPSISPCRSPKAVSPARLSPTHTGISDHSSGSVSPKGTHLEDPPKMLRQRTTSIPKIVQLIDDTASDMGLLVAAVEKRDSLALARELAAGRRGSLPTSITEPDLRVKGSLFTASMARTGSKIHRKASRTVTPPRIRISEESHPLQPPNTRAHSPRADRPVLTQAAVERIPPANHSWPTLPEVSIMAPSSSSTISPNTHKSNIGLSVSQRSAALEDIQADKPGQAVISLGESAVSPGGQSLFSPSEYLALASRESSPKMFTQSNMPTPSDEQGPFMMDPEREYDRDAALVQRATRFNSVPSSVPTNLYHQDESNTLSKSPREPFDPAFVAESTSNVVFDSVEAVMEPQPTPAGDSIDSRVSRTRKRQVSDPSQLKRNERKSSHYDCARTIRRKNDTQTSSYPSTSSELLSSSPEPQFTNAKTFTLRDEPPEPEVTHIPVTEPLRHPAESASRIPRPPMRSFRSKVPSPWDNRLLTREAGESHRQNLTPDNGSGGQFWTSNLGAKMERKWFGRHGSGEGQPGPGDEFVP